MKNNEAVKLIEKIMKFCADKKVCNQCCFADDDDGHCMLTDAIPTELDIKEFKRQAKILTE